MNNVLFSAHHCQLIECLMAIKSDVITNILSVIAYGTSLSRLSATRIIFYYWPTLNPTCTERKPITSPICKWIIKNSFISLEISNLWTYYQWHVNIKWFWWILGEGSYAIFPKLHFWTLKNESLYKGNRNPRNLLLIT